MILSNLKLPIFCLLAPVILAGCSQPKPATVTTLPPSATPLPSMPPAPAPGRSPTGTEPSINATPTPTKPKARASSTAVFRAPASSYSIIDGSTGLQAIESAISKVDSTNRYNDLNNLAVDFVRIRNSFRRSAAWRASVGSLDSKGDFKFDGATRYSEEISADSSMALAFDKLKEAAKCKRDKKYSESIKESMILSYYSSARTIASKADTSYEKARLRRNNPQMQRA